MEERLGGAVNRLLAAAEKTVFFLGLHFQELGGDVKNVSAVAEMEAVLFRLPGLKGWKSSGILFEANVEEGYTALGSVYFVRDSHVEMVQIYDRRLGQMVSWSSFLQEQKSTRFYSFCRTRQMENSRKGYLQLSFEIMGHRCELINVHFPADATNIVASATHPSQYALNRATCLAQTMKECEISATSTLSESSASTKALLAGDFNFRLSLKKICDDHLASDDLLEAKFFRCRFVDDALKHKNGLALLQWDEELSLTGQPLMEHPRQFPPTYCRRADDSIDTKRCPAWPDRVLVTPAFKQAFKGSVRYESIVWNCDHHIVYLVFNLEVAKPVSSLLHHPLDEELEATGKLVGGVGQQGPHPRRRRGPNMLYQIAPVVLAVSAVVGAYWLWKKSL